MNIKGCIVVLALLTVFSSTGLAIDGNAGSCLLFPYFDTALGIDIFSITNVGPNTELVRLVFVNQQTCEPREVPIKLTANDTFTFLVSAVLGSNQSGFMYAYVVDPTTNLEMKSDVLIGQEVILETPWSPGDILNFTINAAAYRGIEVNPDGLLHLDGREYDAAPWKVYFPRFFGQFPPGPGNFFQSRVALINLTGGMHFNARCNMNIYNDNEIAFSSDIKWGCFGVLDLDFLSGGATANAFLLGTAHDLAEPLGLAGLVETGWMELIGDEVVNPTNGVTITEASLYAVLIERFGFSGYGADLPFHEEDINKFHNGALWSTDPDGN